MTSLSVTSRIFRASLLWVVASLPVILIPGCSGKRSDATSGAVATQTAPTRSGAVDGTPGKVLGMVASGKARLIAPIDPAMTMDVTLVLKRPHAESERAFGDDITDRRSPRFGHFLTLDEETARFGPSDADLDALDSALSAMNLHVVHRFRSHHALIAEGTVADVNRGFQVTINEYERPQGGLFFAANRTVTLPPALQGPVRDILGLESARQFGHGGPQEKFVDRPYPRLAARPGAVSDAHTQHFEVAPSLTKAAAALAARQGAPRPRITGPMHTGSLEPPDLWSSQAYNLGTLSTFSDCCNPVGYSTGAGRWQSIAFVENNNAYINDIIAFFTEYGLGADVSLINLSQIDVGSDDGDSEATADIEWATAAVGPTPTSGPAKLYSIAGGTSATLGVQDLYSTWSTVLEEDVARILSSSVGDDESDYCADPGCFEDPSLGNFYDLGTSMRAVGYTLISSAGDNGAYNNGGELMSVHYPASDPHFVTIGGTTLHLSNPDGTYQQEPVWSGPDNGKSLGGGGGGCSSYFQPDSWVPTIYASQWTARCVENYNSPARAIPDISINAGAAQEIYDTALNPTTGWTFAQGTSLGAPEFAGFIVQENSYLAAIAVKNGQCTTGQTTECAVGIAAAAPEALYALVSSNVTGFGVPSNIPSGAPHDPYYDIVTGNNCPNGVEATDDFNNVNNGYLAGGGYDLASGLGTFNALQLAWGLNWYSLAQLSDGNVIGDTVSISLSTKAMVWPKLYTVDEVFSIEATTRASAGIAGFTALWDYNYAAANEGDPTTHLTPGTGDPFYNGPATLGTSGTMHLADAGPGCHSLYVRAWDNMGYSNMITYGPVCFENCMNDIPNTLTLYGTACGSVCTQPGQACCDKAICATGVCASDGTCCLQADVCNGTCTTCSGCGSIENACGHVVSCSGPPCAACYTCQGHACVYTGIESVRSDDGLVGVEVGHPCH